MTLMSTAVTYSIGVNGGSITPQSTAITYSSGVNGGSIIFHSQQQSLTAVVSMGGLSFSTVNSNHLQQWCQWGVYHFPQSTAITYSSGVNGGPIIFHSQQQSLTAVVSMVGGGSITPQSTAITYSSGVNEGFIIPQSTAVTYSCGVNRGSVTLHSQQQSLTAVVSMGVYHSTVNSNHLQQWCQWGSTTLQSTAITYSSGVNGGLSLHSQQQSLTAVVSMGVYHPPVNSNHLQQWCQWGSTTLQSTAITYSSGVNGGLPPSSQQQSLTAVVSMGSTTLQSTAITYSSGVNGGLPPSSQQQSLTAVVSMGGISLHSQQQSFTAVVLMGGGGGGKGSITLHSQQQSLTAVVSMGVYHPPLSTAITYSSGVNRGSTTLHRVSVDLILPTPRLIVDII